MPRFISFTIQFNVKSKCRRAQAQLLYIHSGTKKIRAQAKTRSSLARALAELVEIKICFKQTKNELSQLIIETQRKEDVNVSDTPLFVFCFFLLYLYSLTVIGC